MKGPFFSSVDCFGMGYLLIKIPEVVSFGPSQPKSTTSLQSVGARNLRKYLTKKNPLHMGALFCTPLTSLGPPIAHLELVATLLGTLLKRS